nr:hypothetical protein CFP56_05102 [Quercus suber]
MSNYSKMAQLWGKDRAKCDHAETAKEKRARATEVMAKCFSKSYGVEVHAALGVLDLDTISKTEAYIFLMENPTYKQMFFSCPDHERKCVLLTLMSRPKN